MRARWYLVLGILAGALGAGIWLLAGRPAAGGAAADPVAAGTRLFRDVFANVQTFAVDSLDAQELYRRAAAGIIEELEDPYAELMGPGQHGFSPDSAGPLGLYLDRQGGAIVIVATGTGSPAERAGARPGDLLLGIDSTGVDASRLERARRLLDGPAGTTVALRIRRQGVRSVVTLDVTRGAFAPAPAVSDALLSGGVGSVRVRRFAAGVADSVRRAVERLDAAGAGALVLDLRGAVGGTLQDGVAIADLFLGPGLTLATSRGRPGSPSMTYADSTASPFGSMPMAVLVNRGTAGAAEAAAGALQDHDRAIVLGDTTFGRGVTRSTFALGEGASLRLTTALWITPSGRQIQRPPRASADSASRPGVRSDAGRPLLGGGGIVPDREVPDTGDADLPLDAARKLLLKAGSMRAVLGLAGAR